MLGRSVCLFHVNIPWGGLLSKCGDQASCKMCLNQIMTIKTRAETLVIKRLVQNEGSDLPLVLIEMAVATETSKPDPEQAQASPRILSCVLKRIGFSQGFQTNLVLPGCQAVD